MANESNQQQGQQKKDEKAQPREQGEFFNQRTQEWVRRQLPDNR